MKIAIVYSPHVIPNPYDKLLGFKKDAKAL